MCFQHLLQRKYEGAAFDWCSGFVVCAAVLLVLAAIIGVICFRHHRQKGRKARAQLTRDSEEVVSWKEREAQQEAEADEPVTTVILKRNKNNGEAKAEPQAETEG